MLTVFPCLLLAFGAGAILLPDLPGLYKVGTTMLEIVDQSRLDTLAPSPQARDLVVTLFYPTHSAFAENCTLAGQFPPVTAAAVDSYFGFPAGTSKEFETRACVDAPLAQPDLPLLLFTPGLGGPRLIYSAGLSQIASYGYNVVSVDHPYETLIVEYPDGHVVTGNPDPGVNSTESDRLKWILERLNIRVADMITVLDSLSDPAIISRIPGLAAQSSSSLQKCGNGTKLRTDRVGIYGHSFGGATSLAVLANDTRFGAGIDFDGTLYGPAVEVGTESAFMVIGTPAHNSETEDKSWSTAWPNLRGFKREYVVDGALHNSFTDMPVFRDLLNYTFPPSQDVGPIPGSRILGIEATFIDAFFGRFLKNQDGSLLDGRGMEDWPEVSQIQPSKP